MHILVLYIWIINTSKFVNSEQVDSRSVDYSSTRFYAICSYPMEILRSCGTIGYVEEFAFYMVSNVYMRRRRASPYTNAFRIGQLLQNGRRARRRNIPSDKDLIVMLLMWRNLYRPVGGGRANRIEQIATLSKLSERADRPLGEECATRLLESG